MLASDYFYITYFVVLFIVWLAFSAVIASYFGALFMLVWIVFCGFWLFICYSNEPYA